ncbi:motile sperm domain-containing protein 2-like [Oppia nitens]|uniref:motile sperm domain-containing protein 2-like n=1 Tax=Oppia nitens TaxID=1686743 RepID=UPI0023DB037C|nr:motile sperm domain-containing protein 2-like [Oppia nitens]
MSVNTNNKETIDRIRKRFIETVKSDNNSGGDYHSSDLKRVLTDDWTVERYLLTTQTEDEAIDGLIRSMRWRKSYGINDFNDQQFPREFWLIGSLVRYCNDLNGRPVVYNRKSRYYKCSDWLNRFVEFTVWQFECADRQAGRGGWGLILDSTGAGMSNVDMELTRYLIEVINQYYPRGPRYILAIDLPWHLKATVRLMIGFMSDQLRQIYRSIRSTQLTEYLAPEWIPIQLGGTYKWPLVGQSVVPDGVLSMTNGGGGQFTDDQIKKFYTIYKSELSNVIL